MRRRRAAERRQPASFCPTHRQQVTTVPRVCARVRYLTVTEYRHRHQRDAIAVLVTSYIQRTRATRSDLGGCGSHRYRYFLLILSVLWFGPADGGKNAVSPLKASAKPE